MHRHQWPRFIAIAGVASISESAATPINLKFLITHSLFASDIGARFTITIKLREKLQAGVIGVRAGLEQLAQRKRRIIGPLVEMEIIVPTS
jgi:hypothetical protein